MTSMLLIDRYGWTAVAGAACALIGAPSATEAACRQLLLGRVFTRRLLDHRADLRLVADDPVRRDRLPGLAVPQLDLDGARTFVILARGLDRREHAISAECLLLCFVDIQILEAPPDLRGR